jgi:hypothetical protein
MVKSKQSVIGRNWRNQIRQIGRWVIPVAIWDLLRAREVKVKGAQKDVNKEFVPDILSKNDILRNRHKGKRCFIIGTGPSIQGQDLSPLCSEICFVLNFFYLHPEYKKISPDYYVFSGLANHPHISLTDG